MTSHTATQQQKLTEEFMSRFTTSKDEIEQKIQQLTAPAATLELSEKLTSISDEIQKLSKSLHDAVIFLPAYSVKVRQDEIRNLEKSLKEQEDLLIPRKKFGFKSKRPAVDSVEKPIEIEPRKIEVTLEDVEKSENIDSNFLTIQDLKHTTITFEELQLNGNDVLVRNLDGVTLYLNGSPSTLRIANLNKCYLLCGPVRTSVFLENCKNSTVFLCCQQLRTHSSDKIDVYLRVSSRAIIEDCTNIRFAPYAWKHPRSAELHKLAGIDHNMERYDTVDDFNWLAANSKSPNWSILPEGEIIEFPKAQ